MYDDAGSVAKNVVVVGQVPWMEAFTRDYWGTSMKEVTSHKSFRPVTTLSFKLNHVFNEKVLKTDALETFSYKFVNLVLHSLVAALVTEASAYIFVATEVSSSSAMIAQIVTGALFGLHPVHAEAVSNVTSRGELWMSLFFLIAFLSYASSLKQKNPSFMGVYIIPWISMALSLFSKEQGVTTLMSLVIYDFMTHFESVVQYFDALVGKRSRDSICFLRRTLILALETIVLAGFRYYLNGETSPDFIFDQNPAGFSEDTFTRVFSVTWVYCLYVRDMVFPAYLCPDWSGRSIQLIEEPDDERIWAVLLLWAVCAASVYSLFVGVLPTTLPSLKQARRISIIAIWAFMFCPFLLSSNLLVVTGLMKADRVIYLPLLGFCVLEAMVLQLLLDGLKPEKGKQSTSVWTMTYSTVMVQILLLTAKLHERNLAWSHSLNLWTSAYQINPVSHHTMYNCGYELSIQKRYLEAETVMRPIGHPRVDGPSNTFVYAMVLFNLQRCDEANALIDEAMVVLDEKRATGGPRNLPHMLDRSESNLLVAKAHCVGDDTSKRGKVLYDAVQKDPTNTYAIQQAQGLMDQIERMKKYGMN